MLARILIEFSWVRRSRFAPYVLGACVGRWPQRVTDEERAKMDIEIVD